MTEMSLMELYILASEIEKKGMAFYHKLLRKVKTEEGKNLVRYLLKQEEEHLVRFNEMIEGYTGGQPIGKITGALDYDTLIQKYLDAFFPNDIFSRDYMKNIRWNETASLFSFALRMEKDSIRFYEKLKEFDNEQKNHTILDKILEQEHKHVQKLHEVVRQLL